MRIAAVVAIIFAVVAGSAVNASEPDFYALHSERLVPDRETVLKKLLYSCGLMNGAYLGINDLVAALQLMKNCDDPKIVSSQLLAVRIGLLDKPNLMRFIAREIRFCESYPKFPLGFPDSPEGPETISCEFDHIADSIENLDIQHESADLQFLRREAERVCYVLFWAECEKIRSLLMDLMFFIKGELHEELPFDIYTKSAHSMSGER